MNIPKSIETKVTWVNDNVEEIKSAITAFAQEHPFKTTVCLLYSGLVFPLIVIAAITLGIFGIAVVIYFTLMFFAIAPMLLLAIGSALCAWGIFYLGSWLDCYRPHLNLLRKHTTKVDGNTVYTPSNADAKKNYITRPAVAEPDTKPLTQAVSHAPAVPVPPQLPTAPIVSTNNI